MGHPPFKVINQVLRSLGESAYVKNKFECPDCFSSKNKQLSYLASTTQTIELLALIYSDVQGPAPVTSHLGCKYYVSFLDASNHYTWLYPISVKRDFYNVFIKFQAHVE